MLGSQTYRPAYSLSVLRVNDQLPTSLWLEIKLRVITQRGGSYYFLNKGPSEGGAILVKVFVPGEGAQVYSQIRDMDGELTWMEIFENQWVDERKADEYIQKQISFDPDLWALEIEHKDKENPLARDD